LGLTSSVTTRVAASAYIDVIDGAISTISSRRGAFGAISNRLDSTIANLTNMKASIEAAKGQVVDADFAEETAKLARAQILMQAATAMLAQANASKNQTLQLING
jgi:flagellin